MSHSFIYVLKRKFTDFSQKNYHSPLYIANNRCYIIYRTKEQKNFRIELPPLSNNNTNAVSRKGLFKRMEE